MKQIRILIFSVATLFGVLDSGNAQPQQQRSQSSQSAGASQQSGSPQAGAATGSTFNMQPEGLSQLRRQGGRQSSPTQQQAFGGSGNQGQGFVGNPGTGNGPGNQGGNGIGSGNQRSGDQDPRREFSQNALRFDSNDDGQLAANELTNLFLTLAATLQREQANFYNNLNNRRPQAITGTIINNRRGTTTTTTTRTNQVIGSNSGSESSFNSASARLAQRQDMRQAVFVFLQLAMQFDSNGDGLLSQSELLQLASALVANDLSLVGAAGSVSGSTTGNQSAQQRSTSVTTTTRQTTRMSANSPNRFGLKNGVKVGGINSGFGFGLQSVNQQQPNIALGTRTIYRGNGGPAVSGSPQQRNASNGTSNATRPTR